MRRLNHILSKKEQCSTAVFKTVTKYASYDFWGLDSMKKADSLSDDFPCPIDSLQKNKWSCKHNKLKNKTLEYLFHSRRPPSHRHIHMYNFHRHRDNLLHFYKCDSCNGQFLTREIIFTSESIFTSEQRNRCDRLHTTLTYISLHTHLLKWQWFPVCSLSHLHLNFPTPTFSQVPYAPHTPESLKNEDPFTKTGSKHGSITNKN